MMRLPYNCPVPPCFGVDRWDIWDASDVSDVWGVWGVGCGTCGVWYVWDVWGVGCWTCGVWGVRRVVLWKNHWWGSVLYSYEDH